MLPSFAFATECIGDGNVLRLHSKRLNDELLIVEGPAVHPVRGVELCHQLGLQCAVRVPGRPGQRAESVGGGRQLLDCHHRHCQHVRPNHFGLFVGQAVGESIVDLQHVPNTMRSRYELPNKKRNKQFEKKKSVETISLIDNFVFFPIATCSYGIVRILPRFLRISCVRGGVRLHGGRLRRPDLRHSGRSARPGQSHECVRHSVALPRHRVVCRTAHCRRILRCIHIVHARFRVRWLDDRGQRFNALSNTGPPTVSA